MCNIFYTAPSYSRSNLYSPESYLSFAWITNWKFYTNIVFRWPIKEGGRKTGGGGEIWSTHYKTCTKTRSPLTEMRTFLLPVVTQTSDMGVAHRLTYPTYTTPDIDSVNTHFVFQITPVDKLSFITRCPNFILNFILDIPDYNGKMPYRPISLIYVG
jgi:hypothetical protein